MMRCAVCVIAGVFLVAGHVFAGPPVIQKQETFTYRVMVEGKEYTEKIVYRPVRRENKRLLSYTSTGNYSKSDSHQSSSEHRWEVLTDTAGVPIAVHFFCEGNHVKTRYDGAGKATADIAWYGKKFTIAEQFKKNVTMENALVARSLDLTKKDRYIFDLIQIREMPRLKAYEMYFQVVGDATVKVKAGSFKCKKVLFSINGFFGNFYKAYYYITDDDRRYIVRMENMPQGGTSDLASIE